MIDLSPLTDSLSGLRKQFATDAAPTEHQTRAMRSMVLYMHSRHSDAHHGIIVSTHPQRPDVLMIIEQYGTGNPCGRKIDMPGADS